MRKLLLITAALVALASGTFFNDYGGHADGTKPVENEFHLEIEAHRAVAEQKDRQFAKCKMDANKYVDEHAFSGQGVGRKWGEYVDLCMNAAGWKNLTDFPDMLSLLKDWARREREWLVAKGVSEQTLKDFDIQEERIFDRERKEESGK
jgi:hypothetical protein